MTVHRNRADMLICPKGELHCSLCGNRIYDGAPRLAWDPSRSVGQGTIFIMCMECAARDGDGLILDICQLGAIARMNRLNRHYYRGHGIFLERIIK